MFICVARACIDSSGASIVQGRAWNFVVYGRFTFGSAVLDGFKHQLDRGPTVARFAELTMRAVGCSPRYVRKRSVECRRRATPPIHLVLFDTQGRQLQRDIYWLLCLPGLPELPMRDPKTYAACNILTINIATQPLPPPLLVQITHPGTGISPSTPAMTANSPTRLTCPASSYVALRYKVCLGSVYVIPPH